MKNRKNLRGVAGFRRKLRLLQVRGQKRSLGCTFMKLDFQPGNGSTSAFRAKPWIKH
jgi:hypothetical protein